MGMSIKDHIEAGHYGDTPVVRVPTRSGETALIYSTRHPGNWCIVGVVGDGNGAQMWPPNGRIAGTIHADEPFDLLPPAPRKVKVTAWALIDATGCVVDAYRSRGAAPKLIPPLHRLLSLTGEYEEPWS